MQLYQSMTDQKNFSKQNSLYASVYIILLLFLLVYICLHFVSLSPISTVKNLLIFT